MFIFDGTEKLIIIDDGYTFFYMHDLYSEWKEWYLDNLNFEQAITYVGGEPTVDGNFLGSTYFLINGWKIRPWEGNHELTINGNVYSDDGYNPVIPTIGSYNVLVTRIVSNLIDKVIVNNSALTIEQDQKLTVIYKDSRFHTVLLLDKG